MKPIRIAMVAAVAVALFVTVLVAGSTHWNHSKQASAPLRTMPVPGDSAADALQQMDSYWNDRVTYRTGNFNPARLRYAAEQPDKTPRATPAGRPQRASSRLDGAAT